MGAKPRKILLFIQSGSTEWKRKTSEKIRSIRKINRRNKMNVEKIKIRTLTETSKEFLRLAIKNNVLNPEDPIII